MIYVNLKKKEVYEVVKAYILSLLGNDDNFISPNSLFINLNNDGTISFKCTIKKTLETLGKSTQQVSDTTMKLPKETVIMIIARDKLFIKEKKALEKISLKETLKSYNFTPCDLFTDWFQEEEVLSFRIQN